MTQQPDCGASRPARTSHDRPLGPAWRWASWLGPVVGLGALVWFLIRVIPKPSRAGYPCQRAAFPIASAFVLWVVGAAASTAAMVRARTMFVRRRAVSALAMLGVAAATGALSLSLIPQPPASAVTIYKTPDPVNEPIGVGRGIHPGRVVWVHEPGVAAWDSSWGNWLEHHDTDRMACDAMVSQAVRWLTGQADDADAWDALFRHRNRCNGRGDVGYAPGERIAIKLNLTVCNVGSYTTWTDDNGNQVSTAPDPRVSDDWRNSKEWVSVDVELVAALLHQLVHVAGVPEGDIYLGDPSANLANQYYDALSAEFPGVHYVTGPVVETLPANKQRPDLWDPQTNPREVVQFSDHSFRFSRPEAEGYTEDRLPGYYADAAYFINFALLKTHTAGVTVCGKNHYGSLIRRPADSGYFNMHWWNPGTNNDHGNLSLRETVANDMGHFRPMVDLLGHADTGGKAILYLIDGLYGGYSWGSNRPTRWRMAPFGDGAGSDGNWPCSLLASQDPIAVDSVAYDLWYRENVVSGGEYPFSQSGQERDQAKQAAADDYLHEGALAHDPPSGTFYDPERDGVRMQSLGVHEHWYDDPADADKYQKYSRNLAAGYGIELITAEPNPPVGRYVFYNNSRCDDNDPAANGRDDDAIAPDKVALLPGRTASFANYTSYSRGINGVMVDIEDAPGVPGAGDFRFRMGNCTPGGAAEVTVDATLIEADFDAGPDGFVYADDTFRRTAEPGYASGTVGETMGRIGGGLKVLLGGVDDVDVEGMSGGFSRSFTASGTVRVSFWTKLTQSPDYEADEPAEALVSIDGRTYVVDTPTVDPSWSSGWTRCETVITLEAGSHTLTSGGSNAAKTTASEQTEILIDDVVVEAVTVDTGWSDAPAPASVTVRANGGKDGADRVTIVWADGAIKNRWLEVTVLATSRTGLRYPDVFYFGNAVGETGDNPASAAVNPSDEINARNNPHNLMENPAAIDDACDIDRDGRVCPTDVVLIRHNATNYNDGTALPLITAP